MPGYDEDDDDKVMHAEAIFEAKYMGRYGGAPEYDQSVPQSLYESEALMIADFNKFFIQVLIGNMPSEKLVWCFNDWQRRKGERAILSPKAFGKQFRKIVPEMRPAPDVKITPVGIKRQMNCFEIPEIDVCRTFFETHQGWKFKTWSSAEKFEMLYVDKALWYKDW